MTATVIIIGSDAAARRVEKTTAPLQSTLPLTAEVVAGCPKCPGTKIPVVDPGSGTWSFVAAAQAPEPTTEIYVINFATVDSAQAWVQAQDQQPWLTSPGPKIYIVDNNAMP